MSIDYYRLREMVQVAENHIAYDLVEVYAAENELENLAPELARELLRLRDGVEKVLEGLIHGDGLLEDYGYGTPGRDLTNLLNGGNK